MPRYRDGGEYQRRYQAIDVSQPDKGHFKEFYALRKECLTPSITLEHSGLTILCVGGIAYGIAHYEKIIALRPRKKLALAGLGCLAALATIGAEVASLFVDFYQGAFPHWADSLGIPLFGMVLMLPVLLGWAILHAFLLPLCASNQHWLGERVAKSWIVLLIGCTGFMGLAAIYSLDFWLIPPACLWLAFYLALWPQPATRSSIP